MGETISAERLNYLISHFCIFILKIWWTQILCHTSHFNASSIILQHFLSFLNSLNLKRAGLIFLVNQFCRKTELFGPLFCISIFKIWRTQILRYSIYFTVFYVIPKPFFNFLKLIKLKRTNLIILINQFCRTTELFGW